MTINGQKQSRRVISIMFAVVGGLVLPGCVTTSGGGESPQYDQGGRQAVTVKQSDRGAVISSDERILFDTGKSEISPDGQVFLDRMAKLLTEKTNANIAIEGHTDNIGGIEYNQHLSQ
ncbi:MAG: OmpA family protein, partial [Pseudomonadota bacterium]